MEYPTDNTDLVLSYISICLPGFLISTYVFCKSKDIKLKATQIIYILLVSVCFTALFVFLRFLSNSLAHLFYYIVVPVLLAALIRDRSHLNRTIAIGLVSISFVSVFEFLSILIQCTVFWMFGIDHYGVYIYFVSQLITLALCILFMNIKRFRRGFKFFQEEKTLGLGLALSAIIMILKCINLRENRGKIYLYVVFVVGIIIAGFGLYLWICRSITAHYRERLQLKSEEHYKEVLEERDKEIEKLNQSNEYLAKIIHRDNHLMSALDASVDAYFNSTKKTDKDTLLRELQTLAKERGELIAKEQLESKLLPTTGNFLIDGVVNDLYIKAAAHRIDFNLTVSSTVDEIIGKYITQTDLQTLLSDHIKDAVIAVDSRGEAGGQILVNLSMQNNNYCIDIYDNGVEFDIDTLSKLGLERVTTHVDTGGSGIGFMTTFETLRKAYASLIITEFENRTPFSKSVSFRFDGESVFIIHSYRSGELKKTLNRTDIIIDN